jgi:CrcB protein
MLRFWLADLVDKQTNSPFPWGTLVVNVLGSFFIGLLWQLAERALLPAEYKLILMTGLLGALTTFSTFSLQNVLLMQDGHTPLAVWNVTISTALGLLAAWGGIAVARAL